MVEKVWKHLRPKTNVEYAIWNGFDKTTNNGNRLHILLDPMFSPVIHSKWQILQSNDCRRYWKVRVKDNWSMMVQTWHTNESSINIDFINDFITWNFTWCIYWSCGKSKQRVFEHCGGRSIAEAEADRDCGNPLCLFGVRHSGFHIRLLLVNLDKTNALGLLGSASPFIATIQKMGSTDVPPSSLCPPRR